VRNLSNNMNDATSDRPALLRSAFFVGPIAMSAIPILTPILFAGFSVALIGAARRRGAPWRYLLSPTPSMAACLALAIYVFLNASWSADPTTGFRKAAVFASLVLMSFAAAHAATLLDRQTYCRIGLFFAAGVLAGALFVLAELLTHGITTSFAMNWIPILFPHSPNNIHVALGQTVSVNLDQLNRNVGIVILNLWPGLLALQSLKGPVRTTAISVLFLTIGAVVSLSSHAASQVALLGSTSVVIVMWYWPRYVVRALTIAWCLSFVLVIPASLLAYHSGLHMETWLPDTARQRIIIWQYTAEQGLKHPWVGVGVDSTPVLNQQQSAAGIDQPEGFLFPRSLGSHAHNIYLQSWFELGAIGALLFAVAGAAVISLITLLRAPVQPFAAGTFAAFAIVAAFSWSMWQVWFMCASALLPFYLRVFAAAGANKEQS
jgi:O-antigen ligase